MLILQRFAYWTTMNVLLIMLILVTLCSVSPCQIKIDASQCFSSQLVSHVTEDIVTNFIYIYLAVIDERTYPDIKSNASAVALLPPGLLQGEWPEFQKSRKEFFELHNENLAYYQSLETNTTFLPPDWRGSVDQCIGQLIQKESTGLFYVIRFDDPYKVRLEIKYRSVNSDVPRVRSSKIDSGSAIDGDAKGVSLYRTCYSSLFDFTCPRIDSQSAFVLRRADPNKSMHILLNLDNSRSANFDIDILPKKQQCSLTYKDASTLTDSRDVEIHTPPTSVLLDDFWGGEPNRLQLYYIRLQFPGRIVNATCTPKDSYNHVMNNDPNQRDRWIGRGMRRNPDWDDNGLVQCLGMTNTGNIRFTTVTVLYQLPKIECQKMDWPIEKK
jgi:hypothetical protein